MSDDRRSHWDRVYATRPASQVSWFQGSPAPSLEMIAAAGVAPTDSVLDVGGGVSLLVDRLLDKGFQRISVLDVSGEALAASQARLGPRADLVNWLVEDVTRWSPTTDAFDLWHDRAAFHFLVGEADRQAYVRALTQGLRRGGHAVLATFALSGPDRCSGLPVQRYSPEALRAALGAGFELVEARAEAHRTPNGVTQDFVWGLFRKAAALRLLDPASSSHAAESIGRRNDT